MGHRHRGDPPSASSEARAETLWERLLAVARRRAVWCRRESRYVRLPCRPLDVASQSLPRPVQRRVWCTLCSRGRAQRVSTRDSQQGPRHALIHRVISLLRSRVVDAVVPARASLCELAHRECECTSTHLARLDFLELSDSPLSPSEAASKAQHKFGSLVCSRQAGKAVRFWHLSCACGPLGCPFESGFSLSCGPPPPAGGEAASLRLARRRARTGQIWISDRRIGNLGRIREPTDNMTNHLTGGPPVPLLRPSSARALD